LRIHLCNSLRLKAYFLISKSGKILAGEVIWWKKFDVHTVVLMNGGAQDLLLLERNMAVNAYILNSL